jgi:beta-glucanase (GH16 family)
MMFGFRFTYVSVRLTLTLSLSMLTGTLAACTGGFAVNPVSSSSSVALNVSNANTPASTPAPVASSTPLPSTTPAGIATPTPSPVPTSVPTLVPTPTPSPTTFPVPAAVAGQNYEVTFNDEFKSLDSISAGSTYNGAKWYNGVEECCMTDTTGAGYVMFPTQVNGFTQDPYSLMSGGGLNITLQKVNNVWYSGVMTSVDSHGQGFSQQYGYFEISMQASGDPGSWPGFWLLNTSDKTGNSANMGGSGEIDVIEQYGSFVNTFCTTYHDWSAGAQPYQNCGVPVSDISKGFHKIGFLWTESSTSVWVDDVQVLTQPTPSVFKQPYYLLVDQGLGGGWPTDKTPSSSTLKVQYVRAWAKK